MILLPAKDGTSYQARLERYDIPQAVRRVKTPENWADRVVEIRREYGRVTVTIGGSAVFERISAPALPRRGFGIAVWNRDAGLTALSLAIPR